MLGFFSFTEITDPALTRPTTAGTLRPPARTVHHRGHQFRGTLGSLAPLPFRRGVGEPLLETFHYMTLYLLRDESVISPFFDLAKELHGKDRFFRQRKAVLSGPFEVEGRWAAPRVLVSPEAVPFRPSRGLYVVVGPVLETSALLEQPGVAGVWQFGGEGRHVTVAFVDGDLWEVADALGTPARKSGDAVEWAGPLEPVDASGWDWFATLSGS